MNWPRIIAFELHSEEEANAVIKLIDPVPIQALNPVSRVALRIVAASITAEGTCMVCGCMDGDCRQCIAKTGRPCSWIDAAHTLCSACMAPAVEILPVY